MTGFNNRTVTDIVLKAKDSAGQTVHGIAILVWYLFVVVRETCDALAAAKLTKDTGFQFIECETDSTTMYKVLYGLPFMMSLEIEA